MGSQSTQGENMNLDSDRADRITINAIARARVVQKEIDQYRKQLCTPHSSNNTTAYMAMLASYDHEMMRLCQIPGVAQALFDEEAP